MKSILEPDTKANLSAVAFAIGHFHIGIHGRAF